MSLTKKIIKSLILVVIVKFIIDVIFFLPSYIVLFLPDYSLNFLWSLKSRKCIENFTSFIRFSNSASISASSSSSLARGFNNDSFFIPLRSWKAWRFERMSLIRNSHTMVTRGSRVPRAPPLHTLRESLPAFLNLHDAEKYEKLCFENNFLGRKIRWA